jgi:hypothetical protein
MLLKKLHFIAVIIFSVQTSSANATFYNAFCAVACGAFSFMAIPTYLSRDTIAAAKFFNTGPSQIEAKQNDYFWATHACVRKRTRALEILGFIAVTAITYKILEHMDKSLKENKSEAQPQESTNTPNAPEHV